MRHVMPVILVSMAVLSPVRADLKPDLAHGEQLHSAHCSGCHGNMTGGDGSTLYTREQRLVNSMQDLKAQVRRCASRLQLGWDDANISDVVYYLNHQYYRFGR